MGEASLITPPADLRPKLRGLRPVSWQVTAQVALMHAAVRDLPASPPTLAPPVMRLVPEIAPPAPKQPLAKKTRTERAAIWAEFKGLTETQTADFMILAIKGGYTFAEAHAQATRSKVGA